MKRLVLGVLLAAVVLALNLATAFAARNLSHGPNGTGSTKGPVVSGPKK